MNRELLPNRRSTPRGYLDGDYKLFHIRDARSMDFGSHTHDFHKIILCLSGNVTYILEGRTYVLHPWDLLLVPKNKIHHSKTEDVSPYERVVLFVSSDYLDSCGKDAVLSECFRRADTLGICLLHVDGESRRELVAAVNDLERESDSSDYASDIFSQSAFLRLMVWVNRFALREERENGEITDKKINAVIEYVNRHYAEPITAQSISHEFYLSKSYLMSRFKSVTGGSLHNYIVQKRLTAALSLLRDGVPATVAARECGFSDYTVFYRSFKKQYGFSPAHARER